MNYTILETFHCKQYAPLPVAESEYYDFDTNCLIGIRENIIMIKMQYCRLLIVLVVTAVILILALCILSRQGQGQYRARNNDMQNIAKQDPSRMR